METDVLRCPYCNKVQYAHEPDDTTAEFKFAQCECCCKWFCYKVKVERKYKSWRDE